MSLKQRLTLLFFYQSVEHPVRDAMFIDNIVVDPLAPLGA
jgi:hypothetical protein